VIDPENIILSLYLIKPDMAVIFYLRLFILKVCIKIIKAHKIFKSRLRPKFIEIYLFLIYFGINDKIFHKLLDLKVICTRL